MGEFKAQILGVILVLGVFAALNGVFASTFCWSVAASFIASSGDGNKFSLKLILRLIIYLLLFHFWYNKSEVK